MRRRADAGAKLAGLAINTGEHVNRRLTEGEDESEDCRTRQQCVREESQSEHSKTRGRARLARSRCR